MKRLLNKKDNKDKISWKYQWVPDDHFVILHIPKTGGTTLRNMVYNHFDHAGIYPTESELLENNGGYLSKKYLIDNPKLDKKNMIFGHYGIGFVSEKFPKATTLCFLRNPIDRILSHVSHILNDPKKSYTDPNDVIEGEKDKIINLQSRILGFNTATNNYNRVKFSLDNIDFVGLTEEFSTSIKLLNSMFGWQLQEIEPLNTKKLSVFEKLTSKSKQIITKYIEPEIITYNMAEVRFSELLSIHNIARENKI